MDGRGGGTDDGGAGRTPGISSSGGEMGLTVVLSESSSMFEMGEVENWCRQLGQTNWECSTAESTTVPQRGQVRVGAMEFSPRFG